VNLDEIPPAAIDLDRSDLSTALVSSKPKHESKQEVSPPTDTSEPERLTAQDAAKFFRRHGFEAKAVARVTALTLAEPVEEKHQALSKAMTLRQPPQQPVKPELVAESSTDLVN